MIDERDAKEPMLPALARLDALRRSGHPVRVAGQWAGTAARRWPERELVLET